MVMEVGGTSSANVQSITLDPTKSVLQNTEKRDQQEDQQQIPKKADIEKAIQQVNDLIQPHHTALHYVLHDKLNKYYVQVVDESTNQVVREIPSKKFLDMHAATLKLLGLLVDDKV